jgi:hypothetical protein
MHSFVYKYIPSALSSTWVTNLTHRTTNNDDPENVRPLRNDDDFYIPAPRTDFLARQPYFNLPKIWNNAPTHLKNNSSKIQFPKELKNSLVDQLSSTNFCTRLLCPVCHIAPNIPT